MAPPRSRKQLQSSDALVVRVKGVYYRDQSRQYAPEGFDAEFLDPNSPPSRQYGSYLLKPGTTQLLLDPVPLSDFSVQNFAYDEARVLQNADTENLLRSSYYRRHFDALRFQLQADAAKAKFSTYLCSAPKKYSNKAHPHMHND